MNTTEVLDRLTQLGITARTAGEKLLLEPGSKVPADLMAEVKEHKSDIVSHLRREESAERSALLDRLRTGQAWLLDQHQRWQNDDTTAATDAEFSRVWNGWWELDDRLRAEHGFQGCVFGPNGICPEGFPCQGCADLPVPGVVAHLELTGTNHDD